METPIPQPEPISRQTITERPAQPIVQHTILLRFNLRLIAAIGASLIVVGAFLPWIDPQAQALLGASRLTPVIQSWPALLIGLIAVGVLTPPHPDNSKWVSLPAAALGLAAAVIAVVSALTAANTIAAITARFPDAQVDPTNVTGVGIIFTVAGGLLCLIAGLSRLPGAATEARLDLRPGQPEFAMFASSLVLVALAAGLIGALIASAGSRRPDESPAAFPSELLATSVIDAQITPLGPTPDLTSDQPEPTPPTFPTEAPEAPTSVFFPTDTPEPTLPSPLSPTTLSAGPDETETPTPTPTATTGPSPLEP
ncbi:MAG TPA: hypothetical protein VJG32_12345 [Anaerolineae bacterium]|nr:hypothetical protein [Anaerolineae bacterium]